MKNALLGTLALALPGLFAGDDAPKVFPSEVKSYASRAGFAQIDSYEFESLAWARKELKKAPTFRSEKVRYTFWVLGNRKNSVALMAWDEFGGTGSGYDTLYFDLNCNGDLTEEGERIEPQPELGRDKKPSGNQVFTIQTRETDGEARFELRLVMAEAKPAKGEDEPKAKGLGEYSWHSGFTITYPNAADSGKPHRVKVGMLPGNLQIQYAHALAEAPVYRLGGPAYVQPFTTHHEGRKRIRTYLNPGEHLGAWKAGSTLRLDYAVSMIGDGASHYLRFWESNPPGGRPQTMLRVLGDNGSVTEEIAFHGGCG